MSRCKCCNVPMYDKESPHVNKYTHEEDDLCISCRGYSKHATVEHEYCCGANPRDGVTAPTPTDG